MELLYRSTWPAVVVVFETLTTFGLIELCRPVNLLDERSQ